MSRSEWPMPQTGWRGWMREGAWSQLQVARGSLASGQRQDTSRAGLAAAVYPGRGVGGDSTVVSGVVVLTGYDPSLWYSNYTMTYLERDVRQLINVRELGAFQRFIRLIAQVLLMPAQLLTADSALVPYSELV